MKKNMEKNNIVDRARRLQHRIDHKVRLFFWDATLPGFLFFVGMVFVIVGLGLFMYCILGDINLWKCQALSSPLLYLGVGLVCFCFFLFEKYT